MSVSLSDRFVASADVLCQQVGEESVLLDLASEAYFGLDPVGTRIWQLLEQPTSLQAVHDQLLAEYAVGPEQLQADLLALVHGLTEAGLVRPA